MKKILFLVIAFLLLGGSVIAQRHQPLKPYKEGGYTISEVKSFILDQDYFTANYRREILGIINTALQKAGKDITLNEHHLYAILESTEIAYRNLPRGYVNSYRDGNQIVFFKDNKGYQGRVCIFTYDKVQIIWAKDTCMNLLKIHVGSALEQKPLPNSGNASPKLVFNSNLPSIQDYSETKKKEEIPENVSAKVIYQPVIYQPYVVGYNYGRGMYFGQILAGALYRAYGRTYGGYSNWSYRTRLSCPTHLSGRRRLSTPTHLSGRRRFSSPVHFSGRTRFSHPVRFTHCGSYGRRR